MKNMNDKKQKLKIWLLEDKFNINENKLRQLKDDLINIFEKYTKIENGSINIKIKVLDNGEYLVEISAIIKDFY